jgi:hypothetical protein
MSEKPYRDSVQTHRSWTPSRAKASALLRPMPELPPLTIAFRPRMPRSMPITSKPSSALGAALAHHRLAGSSSRHAPPQHFDHRRFEALNRLTAHMRETQTRGS